MTIIFAVTRDQIPVYHELSKLLEGSTVGELANDSSNIVELVKNNYDVRLSFVSYLIYSCQFLCVYVCLTCLGQEGLFVASRDSENLVWNRLSLESLTL